MYLRILAVSCLVIQIFAFHLPGNINRPINELVTEYGYPVEKHEIQTEDGYLLTMIRINNENITGPKPAALLMHGALSSSADWINWGAGKALGYLLADAGYDVWLGNQRGNTWSRNHSQFNPDLDKAQFFNFSFHEIGFYDLTAKIDYILSTVGQDNLVYIGHSQGTASFFAMASSRPEYNSKIKLMVALAPVTYVGNISNPWVKLIAANADLIYQLINLLQINEILPFTVEGSQLAIDFCGNATYQELCANLLFAIAGNDSEQLDRDFLLVILQSFPAGGAIKQAIHFLQEYISGNFCQYDYGLEGNMAQYGQETPPNYDLTLVTAPVILHYSENDALSSLIDLNRMASELPNLVAKKQVPWPLFNHMDYMWAKDVDILLNNEIIAEINSVVFN